VVVIVPSLLARRLVERQRQKTEHDGRSGDGEECVHGQKEKRLASIKCHFKNPRPTECHVVK